MAAATPKHNSSNSSGGSRSPSASWEGSTGSDRVATSSYDAARLLAQLKGNAVKAVQLGLTLRAPPRQNVKFFPVVLVSRCQDLQEKTAALGKVVCLGS